MPPGGRRRPPGPSPTLTGRRTPWPGWRGRWLQAGQGQQAEAAARSITDPEQAGGRPGPGGGGAGSRPGSTSRREAAARSITDPGRQADVLARVAGAG